MQFSTWQTHSATYRTKRLGQSSLMGILKETRWDAQQLNWQANGRVYDRENNSNLAAKLVQVFFIAKTFNFLGTMVGAAAPAMLIILFRKGSEASILCRQSFPEDTISPNGTTGCCRFLETSQSGCSPCTPQLPTYFNGEVIARAKKCQSNGRFCFATEQQDEDVYYYEASLSALEDQCLVSCSPSLTYKALAHFLLTSSSRLIAKLR